MMNYYHYYSYPVLHELTNTYDKYLVPRKYVASLQEGIVYVTEKSLLELAQSGPGNQWKINDAIRGSDNIVWFGLDSLREGINSLNADFNMAMGGVLVNFEMTRPQFRAALNKIIERFQNDNKTEAENNFRDALKCYRDGCRTVDKPELFTEAIKKLQVVIDKYRENPLAYLHMAHIYHYQDQVRNMRRALDNYTLCYTFASYEPEQAVIAAQGCLYAGWLTASVFGNMQSAVEITKKALEFDPSLGPAHYQLAKLYGAFGDLKEAMSHLRLSLNLDRKYVLKIEVDDDFKMIKDEVKRILYDVFDKDIIEQEKWLKENRDTLSSVMKLHADDKIEDARKKSEANDYAQIIQAILIINKLKIRLQEEAGKRELTEEEKEKQQQQEEARRKNEEEELRRSAEEARMKAELKARIEAEMQARIEVEKEKQRKKKLVRGIIADLLVLCLAIMLGTFFIYGVTMAGFVLLLASSIMLLAWVML